MSSVIAKPIVKESWFLSPCSWLPRNSSFSHLCICVTHLNMADRYFAYSSTPPPAVLNLLLGLKPNHWPWWYSWWVFTKMFGNCFAVLLTQALLYNTAWVRGRSLQRRLIRVCGLLNSLVPARQNKTVSLFVELHVNYVSIYLFSSFFFLFHLNGSRINFANAPLRGSAFNKSMRRIRVNRLRWILCWVWWLDVILSLLSWQMR